MKKVEKTFKKGIDKGKVVWYNSQAVRPKGKTESTRSLKIEQQERSTKHIKNSASARSRRKSYILNKVKEAKKE